MSEAVVYRGRLITQSNGEDPDLLGLWIDPQHEADILAETLNDDIHRGRYLSVRYYLSDQPVPAEELDEALLRSIFGEGDFEYQMHYSDITGYLWTDENLMVGGHDLLAELKTHLGKWLHMEIAYSKEPRPEEPTP